MTASSRDDKDSVKAAPFAAARRVRDFLKVWKDVRGEDQVICRTGAATELYAGDLGEMLKDLEHLSAASSIAPLHADALDALVELVRLKRIKERMEETGTPNGPNNAELTDLEREYKAAKPGAWGYAKSVVDGTPRSAIVPNRKRIEEAHSYFTKTAATSEPWHEPHESFGLKHRPYAQGDEECYICTLLRENEKLRSGGSGA